MMLKSVRVRVPIMCRRAARTWTVRSYEPAATSSLTKLRVNCLLMASLLFSGRNRDLCEALTVRAGGHRHPGNPDSTS
jgi:hypothetical protein